MQCVHQGTFSIHDVSNQSYHYKIVLFLSLFLPFFIIFHFQTRNKKSYVCICNIYLYFTLSFINSDNSWQTCFWYSYFGLHSFSKVGNRQKWINCLSFSDSLCSRASKFWLGFIKSFELASCQSQRDKQFGHFCLIP